MNGRLKPDAPTLAQPGLRWSDPAFAHPRSLVLSIQQEANIDSKGIMAKDGWTEIIRWTASSSSVPASEA
jgi:hypothetical protein